MKTYYVYKITNPNGAIYIGQTENLKKRIKKYRSLTCKAQRRIYNSIRKYGWTSHKFEIIYRTICTLDDVFKLEIMFIEAFKSFYGDRQEYGLNLTRGGRGVYGMKVSNTPDEFKKPKPKRTFSEEHRRKLSEANKGRVISKEHREKLRLSNTGRKKPLEECKRISDGKKGWIPREETKKKMSEAYHRIYDRPDQVDRRKRASNRAKLHIGEKNPKAILTESIIMDIVNYLNDGKSDKYIQEKTGVYRKHIAKIKSGNCWTYITDKLLDRSKLYKRVDKKLTVEQEDAMRELYKTVQNYSEVGRMFNVDQKRAMRVINRNNKL